MQELHERDRYQTASLCAGFSDAWLGTVMSFDGGWRRRSAKARNRRNWGTRLAACVLWGFEGCAAGWRGLEVSIRVGG